jgi:hypothetical protein
MSIETTFGTVRTSTFAGEPAYCQRDIARALGRNLRTFSREVRESGTPVKITTETPGGPRDVNFLTRGHLNEMLRAYPVGDLADQLGLGGRVVELEQELRELRQEIRAVREEFSGYATNPVGADTGRARDLMRAADRADPKDGSTRSDIQAIRTLFGSAKFHEGDAQGWLSVARGHARRLDLEKQVLIEQLDYIHNMTTTPGLQALTKVDYKLRRRYTLL